MITLSTNTGTEQDIKDAMVANGIKPEETAAPEVKDDKPVEDKSKSAASEAPGEKVPAEPGKESEAATDAAKDKSQEKPPEQQAAETTKTPDTPDEAAGKEKAKGGFQKKIDKLTKTVDLLQSQIEAKEGNETRLRRELEEAQAELAKLKPAEPETPKELVRPKRPTLKEFDFDQEKYDAAAEKYDADLDAYHAAVTQKTVADTLKAENEARAKQEREAQTAKAIKEFEDRRNKGKDVYDDYDELMAALPEKAETLVDKSRVVADYIQFKSKDPAHLIHFLMKDFLEGDEAEANRFMQMDDYDQLIAIKELEDRLIKEHKRDAKAKADEPAEAAATAAAAGPPKKAAEAAPPAKEKQPRAQVPDEPIAPVGNSAPAKGKDLQAQMEEAAAQGNGKEFRRLLALQQQEKYAART